MRLRDRIGNYFKYVDHALIHNPDPKSAHYMNGMSSFFISKGVDQDRYVRDFAAYDKERRAQKNLARQSHIELKRYALSLIMRVCIG